MERWDHLKPKARPPKVLADLFEAVVGAAFLQHGFLKVDNWLRTIFEPILNAATKDYWFSATRTLAFYRDHRTSTFSGATHIQQRLLDYICVERDFFEDRLSDVLHTLPNDTIFYFDEHEYLEEPDNERLEVAAHFLNLCICHTIIRIWPQYGYAKAKAAHLSSSLTGVELFSFSWDINILHVQSTFRLQISAIRPDFKRLDAFLPRVHPATDDPFQYRYDMGSAQELQTVSPPGIRTPTRISLQGDDRLVLSRSPPLIRFVGLRVAQTSCHKGTRSPCGRPVVREHETAFIMEMY